MLAYFLNSVKWSNAEGGEKLLAEKIRILCKDRGMTLAELERTIGLGNGTIRRWSEHSPRVDNVKQVADFFEVPVDDLLRNDVGQ